MLLRLRRLTFALLTAAAACAAPAYDFSALTAIAEEANAALGLRGAGLRVMIDGRPVYQRYFGNYSAATIVPIASASKTLSAAVLLALVDEGKLSLDDKVAKFIPSFNKPGGYADITLRQCFSHTSGLPGSEDNDALSNTSITLAQSADLIAQIPLIGPPGAQFAYGGLSMQVAGRCAEVATGKSWDQLFREKITLPLSLDQVDFTTISLLAPYRFSTNPRIAGGARCSLGDYSTFVQMLLNRGLHAGRRILSEASVRELQRVQNAGLPVFNSPLPVDQSFYGIGAWITQTDAAGLPVETTAAGAFGFSAWFDPSRRLSAVYLVLDQGPTLRPYIVRLQAALRALADTTPPSAADLATRLNNLSVRATAGTGSATLIAGFALADGDRTLLLRGVGPGLAAFGVPGTVTDPALTLFRGATVVAANDNWTLLDGRALGAFPLAAGSADAVLAGSLPPGGYTAQIAPVPPATAGAALAEIYDAGSGSGRLTNLSARSTLAANGRLIAGFTITGQPGSLKKILLRAAGPALLPLGVADALADPKLELYDATSTLIAVNDDWTGATALSTAFASVGAFPFPALTSQDAALVVNLPPSGYTVQISGATTGNTLVELYELR
jgi:CubicO group peptidase (beta-lactamase class C family)